jgi:hypothetical protein
LSSPPLCWWYWRKHCTLLPRLCAPACASPAGARRGLIHMPFRFNWSVCAGCTRRRDVHLLNIQVIYYLPLTDKYSSYVARTPSHLYGGVSRRRRMPFPFCGATYTYSGVYSLPARRYYLRTYLYCPYFIFKTN